MTTPLIPTKRQIKQAQLHRKAVMVCARLAAKRAVQNELREQGVRVTTFPSADLMRLASEYLGAHPELYQQALERANSMGYVDPLHRNRRVDPTSLSVCTTHVQNGGSQ